MRVWPCVFLKDWLRKAASGLVQSTGETLTVWSEMKLRLKSVSSFRSETMTKGARRLLVAAAVLYYVTPFAAPQESPSVEPTPASQKTPPPKVVDSDLVRAAKSAGAARKRAKVSLNNADVKKSTGKLMVISGREPVSSDKAKDAGSSTQARKSESPPSESALLRLTRAEREVARLEAELERVEQAYYAESDPNYRSRVITPRFEQIRRQLDLARQELADAHDGAPAPKPVS